MTFDQIVQAAMDRLNLTSEDAYDRIAVYVNDRYRRVTTSIGLVTSKRGVISVTVTPSDTSNFPDLPELTVDGLEKINKIHTISDSGSIDVLVQKTYDDIVAVTPLSRIPRAWAPKKMLSQSVIIVVDGTPSTPYTLYCEGYEISDTLSDDAEPAFPESFHDILVEGAMSDELRKMEKPQLASLAESTYQSRLSDLRMFIAKSAYLDIAQGKNSKGNWPFGGWTRISLE